MELTYGDYLKVPELLELQELRSDAEHDEMLFIIVHQVYELWFKQILHELDQLGAHIDDDEMVRGRHQLVRILKILKTLVQQIDVLETMTPLEFTSFRSFLGSASGFQSAQFREVEFALGAKDPDVLERFDRDPERARLLGRYQQPSIWARFCAMLARKGHEIAAEVLERPPESATASSESVQEVLLAAYRTDPLVAGFCELLTDLDEGLQEWRYRHVKMVQRTIGTKTGTGGSDGAAYLRTTLFKPVFPDLWEIRTRF